MRKHPTPCAERELLFLRLAMRLGFVSRSTIEGLSGAVSADELVACGALGAAQARLVERFVAAALAEHDEDASRALEALDGAAEGEGTVPDAPRVFASFGGGPDAVAPVPARERESADDVPKFASFGGEPDEGADVAGTAATAGSADRGDRERSQGQQASDPGSNEDAFIPSEAPGRYGAAESGDGDEPVELGRGGMGRVLIAFDRAVGREVAVKELLVPGVGAVGRSSPARPIEQRFLREARVTGQLEHPGIVPVHEIARREDGTLYYAMKVVRGRTLGEALDDCQGLDERLHLLGHFHDVCNAMAYAHSRGVVHRDLKPDNVMVGEFGETVVLDWGLAKARGQEDLRATEIEREVRALRAVGEGKTVDGQVLGTPAYMSPEQADGRIDAIDERSDVWALGAVLYQILTGRPPYEGVDPYEIVGMVLKDAPVPVRVRCAEAPADLAAVVAKAMHREPADRYADAKALAHEIDAYLHGRRVGAYAYSAWELVRRFVSQNKALSAGIGAVLVTILVSAVVVLFAYDREAAARASAEEKEREATRQRQQAEVNLARAYTTRATELVASHDYGQAYVYAAAAVTEAKRSARPVSAELQVEMDSALFEARLRRSLELERTIEMPERQPDQLAFSPDGTKLAVANKEGELSVVSLEPGGGTVTRKPGIVIAALEFSLDGTRLLAGRIDGPLLTLDASDLRQLDSEPLGAGQGTAYPTYRLSPDRTRVLVVANEGIAWLVRRGPPSSAVRLGEAQSVAFSPNGERILRTTRARSTILHDGESGDELGPLPQPAIGARAALSTDGARAATYDGERIHIVDLSGPSPARTVAAKSLNTTQLAFSADGQAVWLSGDAGLLALDARAAGRDEVIWSGSAVACFAHSGDGTRVATASKGAVRLWRVRTPGRPWLAPARDAVIGGAFSRDGSLLTYGDNEGRVYLADRRSDEPPVLLGKHGAFVLGVAVSQDDARVTSIANDFTLKLFGVRERAELASIRIQGFKPPSAYLAALATSPDGRELAVTGPDGRIQLLDPKSLALKRFVDTSLTFFVTALRFSPKGDRLCAAGRQGTLACLDVRSWQPLFQINTEHEGFIVDLVFHPDGTAFYTAGQDGWIKRFATRTGALEKQWRAHGSWVNKAAVSPDGSLLLTTGDDRRTKLWSLETGALLTTLRLTDMGAIAVFSPDGRWFTSGNHHGVELWPDPRTLSVGDPEALLAEAIRTTGYSPAGQDEDGAAKPLAAGPSTASAVSSRPIWGSLLEPGTLMPREVRGKVGLGWAISGKAIPAGTTVELLDAASDRPFAPPQTIEVPPDGRVTFTLPEGVDRFAARTTMGGSVTYQQSPTYAPGTHDAFFAHVPPEAVEYNAKLVGVELTEGTGSISAWVQWGHYGVRGTNVPVGCAQISTDTAARAFFVSPAAQLDPRLDRTHPRSGSADLFNLEPGVHELRARVGEHEVTTKVRVHAGSVSVAYVLFDRDQFPENPTPPRCFAEGSPEDVAWRGEP